MEGRAKLVRFLLLLSLIFLIHAFNHDKAVAFPNFVRHGYFGCVACHVSPTGGGILSEYGRELSRELLSTWGSEGKESQAAYGLVEMPEWLSIGGDFRVLQVTQENPLINRGLFFNMQADVEAAVFYKNITFLGTIGRKVVSTQNSDGLFSRSHWLMYRVNQNWVTRIGKFYPEYGIRVPNHRRFTRQFFGFDQRDETYNFEASWANEKINIFGTVIMGRPDTDEPAEEKNKGFAFSASYFLKEKYRLGASLKHGELNGTTNDQVSFFGILGFTHKFFILQEFDFKITNPASSNIDINSWANYLRINYEFYKGMNVYFVNELYRPDDSNRDTEFVGIGAGLQWFPRPHWELNAEYQKRRTPLFTGLDENLFFFLTHFYL